MLLPPAFALLLTLGGLPLDSDAQRLQALVPTSGTGAELLFDGDPATAWRPEGDPGDEGVLLRLESPLSLEGMGLQACPGSPTLKVAIYVDGESVTYEDSAAGADKETVFQFPERKSREIFVRLVPPSPAEACLGEFRLLTKEAPLKVQPPRTVRGRVDASSVLQPGRSYDPNFLFDGRLEYGWAEGAKGTGAGESLTLSLEDPIELVALQLWNGYQRTEDHFRKNARAGQLSLSVDGGAPMVLKVKDVQGAQLLKLPKPVKGSTLKLTVDKVIAGKKYPDLVLSELRFVDPQGPVTMRPHDVDARRKAYKALLAGTNLEKIVDRSWRKRCPDESYVVRTLKLRGDHTFYLFDVVDETGGERPQYDQVLDGGWAVKKADKPWSTLELAGRRHRIDTRIVEIAGELGPEETESRGVGGGKLEIARVADLDEKAFQSLVAEWSKGPHKYEVSCVGKPGHTYAELVAADAILVRGTLMTELLSR
jgi:hypothetical protein